MSNSLSGGVNPPLQLVWVTLASGGWCPFENVNMSSVSAKGVYIIWYNGSPGRVGVRLGQGDIADRVGAHRQDRQVTGYRDRGLLVTWAALPAHLMAEMSAISRISIPTSRRCVP